MKLFKKTNNVTTVNVWLNFTAANIENYFQPSHFLLKFWLTSIVKYYK